MHGPFQRLEAGRKDLKFIGNSSRASRNFKKPSGSFRTVSGSLAEFRMNFVHAKTLCFCVLEIHRKFTEASGKFPGVSGSFPDPSRNSSEIHRSFRKVSRSFRKPSRSFRPGSGSVGSCFWVLYRGEKGGRPKEVMFPPGRGFTPTAGTS